MRYITSAKLILKQAIPHLLDIQIINCGESLLITYGDSHGPQHITATLADYETAVRSCKEDNIGEALLKHVMQQYTDKELSSGYN